MAKELLSDTTIRATKPTTKDLRLNDDSNLYLLIKPNCRNTLLCYGKT